MNSDKEASQNLSEFRGLVKFLIEAAEYTNKQD